MTPQEALNSLNCPSGFTRATELQPWVTVDQITPDSFCYNSQGYVLRQMPDLLRREKQAKEVKSVTNIAFPFGMNGSGLVASVVLWGFAGHMLAPKDHEVIGTIVGGALPLGVMFWSLGHAWG